LLFLPVTSLDQAPPRPRSGVIDPIAGAGSGAGSTAPRAGCRRSVGVRSAFGRRSVGGEPAADGRWSGGGHCV